MSAKTDAQEEFDKIISKASRTAPSSRHPEDDTDPETRQQDEQDEETRYARERVDDKMKMPTLDGSKGFGSGALAYRFPDQSFDSGRTTGVKGVIADARSYAMAKKDGGWRERLGMNGKENRKVLQKEKPRTEDDVVHLNSDSEEDEEFLEQWRETRRLEIQRDGSDIRNRRTSPSMRRFGKFDEVDAMGYLDAIEKVGRETIVVVFVYDHECPVSQVIETALSPLVPSHPAVHFVKVHYEDIEFDNAGVPAILAYKNQGDLFANLTYIIEQIPEDTMFDTPALKEVLRKHEVL